MRLIRALGRVGLGLLGCVGLMIGLTMLDEVIFGLAMLAVGVVLLGIATGKLPPPVDAHAPNPYLSKPATSPATSPSCELLGEFV